jgi:hypothetical protein
VSTLVAIAIASFFSKRVRPASINCARARRLSKKAV